MKFSLSKIKAVAHASWLKAYAAFVTLSMLLVTGYAHAGTGGAGNSVDLTDTGTSTKKFSDVASNLDGASKTMAGLLIQFVSVGGFVVVAVSLYQLYKASKDEREKPMSAIVGLFIGGAMAAVGTIMWIMRNTVVG
jgi:RsiW-degrading membrane proteinase PrsW (M82 family)